MSEDRDEGGCWMGVDCPECVLAHEINARRNEPGAVGSPREAEPPHPADCATCRTEGPRVEVSALPGGPTAIESALARERDAARARVTELEGELQATRAELDVTRAGWRASERLRAQAEDEARRMREFADALAGGAEPRTAALVSGLCTVCLASVPPRATCAEVATRGAGGEPLHFCGACWGLAGPRYSSVAR